MAEWDIKNIEVPDYSGKTLDQLWEEWKIEFGKTYKSAEEEKHRFEIFKETKELVERHNEKFKAGESTYILGINQFADMEPDEVCGCSKNPNKPKKR